MDTGQCLPKSNHRKEAGISQMSSAFNRQVIPAEATESRWIAADGRAIRRIDWAHPAPRGAILFMNGRGDFYEKYLEAMAHWHAQGWSITAFDWRGQGGSGRLGHDPYTGHVDDFGTWIADLQAFWRDWSATAPGPRIAIGHSMGGPARAPRAGRARASWQRRARPSAWNPAPAPARAGPRATPAQRPSGPGHGSAGHPGC
ncbi:MAG: hypothetical protein RL339_925, partial [Pseudomonadota bacterium]